jgi:hypothetical protein
MRLLLCELIRDCYRVFGMAIDPNQIYTAEGLLANGWSLEDVESKSGSREVGPTFLGRGETRMLKG